MNKPQIFFTIAGLLTLLYLLVAVDVGDERKVLTVKYEDNLVEYVCKDKAEYEHLSLKDRNDCLFFDGQYFFDEAPSKRTKEMSRVEVVKEESRVFNGDISRKDFWFYFVFIVIATLVMLAVTSDNSGGDYYDY